MSEIVDEIRAEELRADPSPKIAYIPKWTFARWADALESAERRCQMHQMRIDEITNNNAWMQQCREYEAVIEEQRSRIKFLESQLAQQAKPVELATLVMKVFELAEEPAQGGTEWLNHARLLNELAIMCKEILGNTSQAGGESNPDCKELPAT